MGAGHCLSVFPDHGQSEICFGSVDYFTKWVEAEALANIQDVDVKKLVWRNIVTRFGVLNNPQKIHRRNSIFPDVWGGGSHTSQGRPM